MPFELQPQPNTASYIKTLSENDRAQYKDIHVRMGAVLNAFKKVEQPDKMVKVQEVRCLKDFLLSSSGHILFQDMAERGDSMSVRYIQNRFYNHSSWELLHDHLRNVDPSLHLVSPNGTINLLKNRTGRRDLTPNQLPHGVVQDNWKHRKNDSAPIIGAAYYYLPEIGGRTKIVGDSAIIRRIQFLYAEGLLTAPGSIHVVLPRGYSDYIHSGSDTMNLFQIRSYEHPFTMESSEVVAKLLKRVGQM